jgi:SAM-dependent methyltransferase
MGLRTRLILASTLMLFLELALIRWTASNVVHLGFFSNFVLLGAFLGVGIGFLRADRTTKAPLYFPAALAILVAGILTFPVTVDRSGKDLIFFSALKTSGPPAWIALPLIFILVAVVMAGPGELVARCFTGLPRLEAYRLDLAGSLGGIALFTIVSVLRTPPFVWGLIVSALTIALLATWNRAAWQRALVVGVPLVVILGALAIESLAANTSWSPYYKIKTTDRHTNVASGFDVSVNGIPHQTAMDAEERVRISPIYGVPYLRVAHQPPGRVLIVGAGTGTDVALALSRGASRIDAVEIDPRIQQIGAEKHPNRPYDDPRVHVHIDDGRAYLQRTDDQFDLIIFALPDSLTLVAGANSLRLESYLFTEESMRSVRDHLKPGGAFAMYNSYREEWLIGRLANTVAKEFGHRPCVDLVGSNSQAVISIGRTPADQHCDPAQKTVAGPAPSTDNHPFLYLKDNTIPVNPYLIALAGIIALSLLAVRVAGGPLSRMRPYGDLFLLGAAFLLLETRSVTGFALLFGTTWIVNAVVFAGVLLIVLLAVEITRRFATPPIPVLYAGLGLALLLAALIRPSLLLNLPVAPRIIVAVVLAFLPVFMANLVFSKRFADSVNPTAAFGANLLGAMLGGCLEYLTLITGYQSLLLIAGLLYAGAFVLLRRVQAPAAV